jgi:hypothetical protein
MNLKIEQALEESGFKPTVPCGRKWNGYYSTMGILVRIWRKDGIETYFQTGLGLVGYPPTLMRPLPVGINDFNYAPKVINWIQEKTTKELKEWINTFN